VNIAVQSEFFCNLGNILLVVVCDGPKRRYYQVRYRSNSL